MQNRVTLPRSIEVSDNANSIDNQFNTINSIEQFQKMTSVKNNVISIINKEQFDAAAILEIKVLVTQDENLLQQYYTLRHQAYNQENGWQDYDGSENEYDRNGNIIAVMRGDKVVGGARIMFSDDAKVLSNDVLGELSHRDIIQKYDKREELIFSEVSAFCVAKHERDRTISKRIIEATLKCLSNIIVTTFAALVSRLFAETTEESLEN